MDLIIAKIYLVVLSCMYFIGFAYFFVSLLKAILTHDKYEPKGMDIWFVIVFGIAACIFFIGFCKVY